MDTNEPRAGHIRRWLVTGAVAAGAALGAYGIAGAATNSSTSTDSSSSVAANVAPAAATNAPNAMPDPATMPNGPGETLLTGDTADKVKAAALAAQPGATVIRVETDSEGSPYEAHMRKADGTEITLKFDSNFKVTATLQGFGGPGPHGPRPDAPNASNSGNSSTSA